MVFSDELGKKVGGAYQLGKKILHGAIEFGKKAQGFVKSEPIQAIYRALPPQIQMGLSAVGRVAQGALEVADQLQQKLNSGEQMVKAIPSARSIELARQPAPNVPRPMEQGAGLRVPDRMITGGNPRMGEITTRTGGPMGPPMMTF